MSANNMESEDISDEIGKEIREAQQMSGHSTDQRIKHLCHAQELLLHRDTSGSLLDNFLDEMLEFVVENDSKMRCFVASFIEKACKKDCDVMKKAVVTLSYLIDAGGNGAVSVTKKVITVVCQIYPVVLKWAVNSRSIEVEHCWEAFCVLKGRIMQHMDSDNEGIRTQTIRFLEAVVLSQSQKTEESERCREDAMCLNLLGRDHRFISYRKMENEAQHSFNSLLEHSASPHISSLNLLACLTCICNIAHQRPQFMQRVIGAFEALHANLPPTLATSQVKSVRKELKMHLMRLLKHLSSTPFRQRITTLLIDLGAAQSEVMRAIPASIDQRRKASRTGEPTEEPECKKAKVSEVDDGVGGAEREDEEEYGDEAVPSSSNENLTQTAIDITAQFVFERLKPRLVTNLVLISLVTLPDEMPAAFQSSYTPIAAAGTDGQIRHLSRLIATQLTSIELGPGVEKVRAEKRQQYMARQTARLEGAVIPPTPAHQMNASSVASRPEPSRFALPTIPSKMKSKIQFGLLSITKQLDPDQISRLILHAFQRISSNEKRAVQGGAGIAQQKLLIRLITRFDRDLNSDFDNLLTAYIIQEQRSRADLALLWISELYAQFQGYSFCCTSSTGDGIQSESYRYERYDEVLCNLLKKLFDRGEHKETLFHKLLLEAPLLTQRALECLRSACLDPVFGAFGMTTLRELILTRTRQRNELLCILLDFSYIDQNDVRNQSIETAKELYQIDYVRDDVHDYLLCTLDYFTRATPPPQLCAITQQDVGKSCWDDITIKTALHLFLSLLSHDHSLIHKLANVYAKASNDIKRVTLRTIDSAVKAMGSATKELLDMIADCPHGAETLAARIVHLLTERNPPSQELVDRITALFDQGRTDVRSLIPVLSGLEKDKILEILPKFVLNPINQKAVPVVFNKLLTSKNIKTGAHPMSASELLIALHRIPVSDSEMEKLLQQNINLLLSQLASSKDVIGAAIDALLDENIFSVAFFQTVIRTYDTFPALAGFLSNILIKIARKKPWKDEENLWSHFVDCVIATAPHSFLAILTVMNNDEFDKLIRQLKIENRELMESLKDYIPTLSAHHQKKIDRHVRRAIMETEDIIENKENV